MQLVITPLSEWIVGEMEKMKRRGRPNIFKCPVHSQMIVTQEGWGMEFCVHFDKKLPNFHLLIQYTNKKS